MYYDSVIYDSFLDDLESKGKIKGTGSFDFDFVVLEFFKSLFIVYIEGQFPYVDTDTDFSVPHGFVVVDCIAEVSFVPF